MEEKKDNPKIMQWTTDLAIRWTSPLSGSSGRGLTGPKYFRVDDLRYELGMTFFLYGSLLRELALEVLSKGTSSSSYMYVLSACYPVEYCEMNMWHWPKELQRPIAR